VFASHGDVASVSGRVDEREPPDGDYLAVSVAEVSEEKVWGGGRVRPWQVGLGVCMAYRRSALVDLGGFDERLGPGTRPFPSSEDMDLNYRLLRSGAKGLVTPAVRVLHDQWRSPADLARHYRGYMAGWAGMAMKHLRTGDLRGGAWLWRLGALDALRMLGSAAKRRSSLRLRVAMAKLSGLAAGTVRGLLRRW
jgi:GT2 family glycosyltransferase